MNKRKIEKFLFDNGVFDAMQFIESAHNTIIEALYYKDFILESSKEMDQEHEQWRNNWKIEKSESNKAYSKVDMGRPPLFNTELFGISISKIQLRDMFIKSFFQSCRNALDMMAQAANVACLATKSLKTEKVDFGAMRKEISKPNNAQLFPHIYNWFAKVVSSDEYIYIDKYCNRTKHTCALKVKSSFAIIGNDNTATIEQFFRQDSNSFSQYDRKDVTDYIPNAYDFISRIYTEFMSAIKQEIPKQTFVKNRFHKLSIYQQKMMDSPENDFSMAYLVESPNFESMPDKIQILLISEVSDKLIIAMNCPIDTIYISSSADDNHFVGKYVAESSIGEDSLLRYRNYKKVTPSDKDLPLIYQAILDHKQNGIFYHDNPYAIVHTTSDDNDFLRRISLPF